MTRHGQTWIASGGGPLLLLPQSLLRNWKGGATAEDETPLTMAGTDYERACNVSDYGGVITVGPGLGFVVGDSPDSTTWHPQPDLPGGWLVRWRYAEPGTHLVRAVAGVRATWELLETTSFRVTRSPLVLFDSAYPGREILTDHLVIELAAGEYAVMTWDARPDAQTCAFVHEFRRTGGLRRSKLKAPEEGKP